MCQVQNRSQLPTYPTHGMLFTNPGSYAHAFRTPERCPSVPCNGNAGGGIQLSSKAMMMMTMMGLMSSLMSGDFGSLMRMLSPQNQSAMPMMNPNVNPGFGQSRSAQSMNGPQQPAPVDGSSAAPVGKGQVREMKPGETVRGANGTLLKWGQGGNVEMSYKDRNGQDKHVSVKDGMISFDGGQPQKLENVGQLLKLPNGDVVGIGNNPQAQGQKLVRVVMADNPQAIACEPANATNVYEIEAMQRKHTTYDGTAINVNVNAGSYCNPWGGQTNYMNTSINMFMGLPVDHYTTEQLFRQIGVR